MIFVTNKNAEVYASRYDGTDYVFPPGQSVPIDEAAAKHMLGYGDPDKTSVLHRMGWAMRLNKETRQFESDPDGVTRLAKFIFSRGEYVVEGTRPRGRPKNDTADMLSDNSGTSGDTDDESPI